MQQVIGRFVIGRLLGVSQTSKNGKKTNENDKKRSWTVMDGHRRSYMVKNVGLKTVTVSHVHPKTVTGW